ncbi:MAG: hypothetical protein RIQ94_1775 [Pseudomonadota bacterium]|jgi:hypothetical protein
MPECNSLMYLIKYKLRLIKNITRKLSGGNMLMTSTYNKEKVCLS